MTKPLVTLILLGLALPLGCSGEEEPPNPLASRTGFCKSWGQAACQESVVSACDSASVEDCVDSQSDFCETIVPETYDARKAEACIRAVKAAYADADLTSEELQVVRHLAAPCDQLSKGTLDEGDECSSNDECNTAQGFSCIKKQGADTGSCETPEEVEAGDFCDLPNQVCGPEHYCDGENCVAFKRPNGACVGDYQCKPDDRCVLAADAEAGTCQPRLEVRDACSADEDCQSRYCVRESGATEGECFSRIRLTGIDPLCDDLQ